MRPTRGHPSIAFSINFSGKPGQPTPRRRQDQSRPLLQLPQSAATQSKGTGSLFLRRKVARAAAREAIDSLDRCIAHLRLDHLEADRPRLRALGPDAVAEGLLGILWHQPLEFGL